MTKHLFTFAALMLFTLTPSCHSQSAPSEQSWTGTWSAAPRIEFTTDGIGTEPVTLREMVHVSMGGNAVRIRISNAFGTEPLKIGRVSIAVVNQAGDLTVDPELLTFGGLQQATIAPGKNISSDPMSLDIAPLSDLAISLLIPTEVIPVMTIHPKANMSSYRAIGDQVLSRTLVQQSVSDSYPFLVAVDVLPNAQQNATSGSVVCLGDSITQGVHSTFGKNHAWPDVLARTLQSKPETSQVGVLNEGIGGNRVFQPGGGPPALSRFDRDVLQQSNIKVLLLAVGINDIGLGYRPNAAPSANRPTAEQMEAAYRDMSERAHRRGIKVIGATITPYGKAAYFSKSGEEIRQQVNQWIRTSAIIEHVYDGIVDFDRLLGAKQNDSRPTLKPSYDSGDGLHPNDSGYEVMGAKAYRAILRMDRHP